MIHHPSTITHFQEAIMTPNNSHLHTLSVYVANKPGVLARIAQCFARRGYNIESLVVSSGMDGRFSRMTIGITGKPEGIDQIIKQVSKLIDVLRCIDHTDDAAVTRELALVKIRCAPAQRAEALHIVEHFNCKTVDLTDASMIIMAAGDSDKVDAFVNMIKKFEVIEMCRTGKVVMTRGEQMT
jgi:acetolactate synthase-1/3 small subunit